MKKRILIVDDSKVVHALIGQFINARYPEIECISAYNGEEAFNLISSGGKFDMVFLDIMMPVMSGIEFLEKIRENGINLSVPVIICSEAEESLINKALSLGAHGRLKKPFKNTELYAIIDKYIKSGDN